MRPIKTFIVGSELFFKNFPDFNPKDIDELNIMDEFPLKRNCLSMHKDGKDVFFYKNMSKDEFIDDTLKSALKMRAGKFLAPEFAEYLGVSIEDLKKLKPCFYNMDEKHKYEKIIYDAYIENGDFVLTDEQREKAYEEYKRTKKGA